MKGIVSLFAFLICLGAFAQHTPIYKGQLNGDLDGLSTNNVTNINSLTASTYVGLPTASPTVSGVVKVDGTTVTINGGVISANTGGTAGIAVQGGTGNGTTLTNLNLASNIVGLAQVNLIRGNTNWLFPSITNSYKFGWSNFDTLILPASSTNTIQGAASGLLSCPPNFTIQGPRSAYVFSDTNAFYYTNSDVFKGFSLVSTNLWATAPDAYSTFYNVGNASNVVFDDLSITTWGNGITSSNSAAIFWTVKNCDVFAGHRALYFPGCAAGSLTTNRDIRISVQENTNQASVTIVGMSLSGPGGPGAAVTNYIDNCTITVDANGSTNPVEYIGIYAKGSYTHIGNTFKQAINTNNLTLGGIVSPSASVALVLFESSLGMDLDGSTPSAEIDYNGSPLLGVPTWPRGDAGRLGVNELAISTGPGISVVSNGFADVPNALSSVEFDSVTNPFMLTFFTNHFWGLFPQQGMSFDFHTLVAGATNNVNFTNPGTGMSVTFYAANGLWVTNNANLNANVLMVQTVTDPLIVSNVGTLPWNGFMGSFQTYTNLANAGPAGSFLNITNEAPNLTNISPLVAGNWSASFTNISRLLAINRNPGNKNAGLTNFILFNGVPGFRQKLVSVSFTGMTNAPTTNQLALNQFAFWWSNAPASGSNGFYVGACSNSATGPIIYSYHVSIAP